MGTLAGVVRLDGAPVDREWVPRMAACTTRRLDRPPKIWASGPAGMLHGLFATTPEATRDEQPIADNQRGVVFCFEGRLDNRQEILAALPLAQRPDASEPDSRLAFAAYLRMGAACANAFAGDYVFAAWERQARRLTCVRSPIGWVPFYWCRAGQVLAFATEPRQLFAGTGLGKEPEEGVLGQILAWRINHGADTIWKGVRVLQPGSSLTADGETIQVRPWYVGPFPEVRFRSDDDYVERFRELFDQALASCMRSNTQVAAHLSGGIDSSSIVCRAARLHEQGRLPARLRPVSILFPGSSADESEWIRQVAYHIGMEPTFTVYSGYDWSGMEELSAETLYLPVRLNGYCALQANQAVIEQGMRVVLTGEGGDDWCAGSFAHWPDLLRSLQLRRLFQEGLDPAHGGTWISRMRGLASHSLGPLISAKRRRAALGIFPTDPEAIPDYIRPEWARKIDLTERLRASADLPRLAGMGQQRLFRTTASELQELHYANVLAWSGKAGIEMRHPLHDRRLVEFALGAPGRLMRRGSIRKWVLRTALGDALPGPVRTRRDKAQFIGILADGLRSRFQSEASIQQLRCVRYGWVNGSRLWRNFRHYFETRGSDREDRSGIAPLWFSASVDLWLKRVFEA